MEQITQSKINGSGRNRSRPYNGEEIEPDPDFLVLCASCCYTVLCPRLKVAQIELG